MSIPVMNAAGVMGHYFHPASHSEARAWIQRASLDKPTSRLRVKGNTGRLDTTLT